MATSTSPSTDPGDEGITAQAVHVERTGIAVVHQDEYIVAAAGSEAELAPAGTSGEERRDTPEEVHYYFPVEIEVVGTLDPEFADGLVDRVYTELLTELSSRQ